MDLDALLNSLGYLRSTNHWVTLEEVDTRLSQHYRLAQRAGSEAGEGANVVGSYVYQTSIDSKLTPPRPAVFVAYAANEQQAHKIHKSLWNLGECPFIVMVLPNVVRVYTGFDYDPQNSQRSIITPDVTLDGGFPDQLKSFHANAIDSGRIWKEQAKFLGSDTRVDSCLLTNLKELSKLLQERYRLKREVTHALIGKYIYFRYLRDRAILDNDWLGEHSIQAENVFGQDATVEGFIALTEALQKRFNGDIFPLPPEDDGQWQTGGAIPFLVGIFNGNTTYGQLALDFQVYDFSYIPIELLSSIYEQFLKAEGRGDGDGVVYTPEALADYVLAELESVRPLQLDYKVLDPCCGSGVFLVLAYRRLINKLWQQENKRPSAEALKRLLQSNVFGVEKDLEACHITAFSLILTLLSHLEPPELHANAAFQFPTLLGENLHQCDFFAEDCPVFQRADRFDWIVGNPPWTGAKAENPDHQVALKWIERAKTAGHPVGEKRLDEAFSWRVTEVLKEQGIAALLIMATSLVNSSSAEYRKAFFRSFQVMRVTNLSNFLRILFTGPDGKRAEAPAACLVYGKESLDDRQDTILHFGPFVANQVPLSARGKRRSAWTISIYEGDVQEIDRQDAVNDVPYLWKAALWGSYQDRRTLKRLANLLPEKLEAVAQSKGWLLCAGAFVQTQRGKSKGQFVHHPELEGKRILEADLFKTRFYLPIEATPLLSTQQEYVYKGKEKGLRLTSAPHLVISAGGAIYSDTDFVIPAPKVGISSGSDDADYLKALALYLNSSIAQYAHFFSCALWGISIGTVNPENVGAIPFKDLSSVQVGRLSSAYEDFARTERDALLGNPPLVRTVPDQQMEIDKIVEETLGVPEGVGVVAREFMAIRYQLIKGKVGDSASKPPFETDLRRYAEQLRSYVDEFTRRHHRISVQAGSEAIIATVEVTNEAHPLPVRMVTGWNQFARDILEAVEEEHSQWAYVCRSVRIFDGPCVHIIKSARLLDWTRTQAIQDAADLISEVLDKTSTHYEQTA